MFEQATQVYKMTQVVAKVYAEVPLIAKAAEENEYTGVGKKLWLAISNTTKQQPKKKWALFNMDKSSAGSNLEMSHPFTPIQKPSFTNGKDGIHFKRSRYYQESL